MEKLRKAPLMEPWGQVGGAVGRAEAQGQAGPSSPTLWCGTTGLGAKTTSLGLVLQEVSKTATEKHSSQGVGVEGTG